MRRKKVEAASAPAEAPTRDFMIAGADIGEMELPAEAARFSFTNCSIRKLVFRVQTTEAQESK